MELHSYAKRRTLKKWTLEQKRRLVESRIAHDAWFTNKPSSLVPWKNILIAANLDDFNVFFVRKQWSNMLDRYKQYKQTRLGNIATKAIDAEQIKRINQEWEFFEPIHKFMTRKTTNLHSYALTHRTNNDCTITERHQEMTEKLLPATCAITTTKTVEGDEETNKTIKKVHNGTIKIKDCAKENIPNNATIVIQPNSNITHDDGIHLFSSDTNEEFQIAVDNTKIINGSHLQEAEGEKEDEDDSMNSVRNTDHDFYSKRFCLGAEKDLQEQQSNYFADTSEGSQEDSINVVVDLIQFHHHYNHHNTQATNSVPPHNVITASDISGQTFEIKSENITQAEIVDLKEERRESQDLLNDMPSTSTHSNITHNVDNLPTTSTSETRLSERDKYYRHKRRFNRRLEKRFDAILQVVGQMVKVEYPSIDVTPLVGAVNSIASSMGKTFSSDSEDDN